jgi:hypothetical protein
VEGIAIALYLAGGLIAAPTFCLVLAKWIRQLPRLARLLWCFGLSISGLFVSDLILVAVVGSVRARELLGPGFPDIHAFVTLLAAPSVACAVLLGQRNLARWWPAVAAFCWLVGAFAIFYQYGVMEALYGIDGIGGPYS